MINRKIKLSFIFDNEIGLVSEQRYRSGDPDDTRLYPAQIFIFSNHRGLDGGWKNRNLDFHGFKYAYCTWGRHPSEWGKLSTKKHKLNERKGV